MNSTLGDTGTLDSNPTAHPRSRAGHLRLVVLHHPDARRVGAAARLGHGRTPLSRSKPSFDGAALGLRSVSRAPIHLEVTANRGLVVDPGGSRTAVRLDGVDLTAAQRVSPADLRAGVCLTLARRVVLWARWAAEEPGPAVPGMLGRSDAIERLRHEIGRVAAFDVPCLIRGETGTGKELVAQGIHALSARRARPIVARNMAALPPAVAPSQLFGHVRGAFTGAARAADGAFVAADGGILFLDEIGACPSPVQAQLLRVLETGHVLPVGATRGQDVDVRVLAATDADLEAGDFRAPLLHRLSGYVIDVPPLHARRGDIPLLFHHFLRAILETAGEAERLIDAERPWIPTRLIETLVRADWPGNVRAVRNMAQTLAVRIGGQATVDPAVLDDRLVAAAPTPPTGPGYRAADDVTEAELLAALAAHRYRIAPAAKALNVSRTTLYALIGLSSRVRTAADLDADEIRTALADTPDLAAAAQQLGVSAHALKLRKRALGL